MPDLIRTLARGHGLRVKPAMTANQINGLNESKSAMTENRINGLNQGCGSSPDDGNRVKESV